MLKKILPFVLLMASLNSIHAQKTYVPDDNFEQALIDLGYDDVLDDYVVTDSISGITLLNVQLKNISNLTGIEAFISLTSLNCSNNLFTNIDLSNNTALKYLYCNSSTQLTSLDVSKNTALVKLLCYYSHQLSSLNLSENSRLLYLEANSCKLASLDVSQNTSLYKINCADNQITNLDLSKNTALGELYCSYNQLTGLNVKNGNNSKIIGFIANNNPDLQCIQVDNASDANAGLGVYSTWNKDAIATYSENCSNSGKAYIPDDNFEQALIDLGIDSDSIINASVFNIDINQVLSLDIESKNIIDLTGIEGFVSLETLDVKNNQLTGLDLSANSTLIELNCSNNQLAGLNVKNGNNQILTVFSAINNPDLQCIKVDDETVANEGLEPYNAWLKDVTASYSEGCLDAELTYIPDENFEQALIDLGIDKDGTINNSVLTTDISGITSLDVNSKSIENLKGIEDFNDLEILQCRYNKLSKLDLSKNAHLIAALCDHNQLEILKFGSNNVFKQLDCYNNQLASIDVSQNSALTILKCNDNQLTNLDVGQNTNLNLLYCFNNELTNIDIGENIAMNSLICFNNQLRGLNVKNEHNSILTVFNATRNPSLTCIQVDDVSEANAGIGVYSTWQKDATATYSDDCLHTGKTYIPDDNFEQALIDLGIDSDGIVNDSVAIADIYQILSLEINNKNISDLTGIESFISLEILNCQINQLSNLDLSKNTVLKELNCSNNQLTGLDVKNGNNNLLTTFDATNNPDLQCIKVDDESAANAGVTPYSAWQKDATARYSEACLDSEHSYIPDENFEQALIDLGIDKDGILNNSVLTSDISGIKFLDVNSKNIDNLKGIEDFISLDTLDCSSNLLTSIDISQNIALKNLECRANQLTSLDVSKNVDLVRLSCSRNQLTRLDVSKNTVLIGLFCYSNKLTSLNVSENVSLKGLYCDQNQLASLNINKNTFLETLVCNQNQLTILNIRNGNNSIITDFYATDNPDLTCIQVDNETDANNGVAPYNNWHKDATASYSEDCAHLTVLNDANFEQALIDMGIISDIAVDGSFLTTQISTITRLDLSSKNISDLAGIEDFTSLDTLIVSNNQLTYLDLSHNTNLVYLDVSNNPLVTLILANGSNLKSSSAKANRNEVFDSNNMLIKIDISDTELDTIDLSNVPNLEILLAQGSKLTSIDVSANGKLTILDVRNNPLTCIQVSQSQFSNIPSGWQKDASASYSTDCQSVSGVEDELLNAGVNLYPNPVTDILFIESKLPLKRVEIYSILGEKVKVVHSNFKSIEFGDLSKGIYLIRIFSEKGITVRKLMKE